MRQVVIVANVLLTKTILKQSFPFLLSNQYLIDRDSTYITSNFTAVEATLKALNMPYSVREVEEGSSLQTWLTTPTPQEIINIIWGKGMNYVGDVHRFLRALDDKNLEFVVDVYKLLPPPYEGEPVTQFGGRVALYAVLADLYGDKILRSSADDPKQYGVELAAQMPQGIPGALVAQKVYEASIFTAKQEYFEAVLDQLPSAENIDSW